MATKIASGKKRARKSLTLNAKLEMIRLSEQGLSMTQIGRKLGLARNTVSTIVNRKEKVLKEVESDTPLNTKVIRKRDSLIGAMEKLLLVWIEDQCRNNVLLTQSVIQDKALSLFTAIKAARGTQAGEDTFKASRGWFTRFKERSLLHNIKELGEPTSAETAATESYQNTISEIIDISGYSEQQIFSVTETCLYWRKMPNGIFTAKEKSKCGLQASKDRFILLLGANAAGDFKLKPMLIYYLKNPQALQNFVKSSLPVYYKYSSKGLMTPCLFSDWFTNYFKPAVENYCKENNIPFKILLLANGDPNHPRALVDLYKEIQVLFLPVNATKLLQPMDQGVITRFKAYYLRNTFAKAINAISHDTEEGHRKKALQEVWEGFSILDGIKTIRDAWEEVTEITLKSSWRHLIPSMEEYESFDSPLEEVIAHVVEMAKEVELKVVPADVEEFLACHDEVIGDNLTTEEQRKMHHEDESHADDSPSVPREMTTKELEEAINCIEMGMAAFERIDPNFKRSSRVNAVLLNSISCYKDILRERKRQSTLQSSLLSYYEKLPPQQSKPCFEQYSSSAAGQNPAGASSTSPALKRMRIAEESDDKNQISLSCF